MSTTLEPNSPFDPEFCHNEREVESKLLVSYLLPILGYPPCLWHQQVQQNRFRLDFVANASHTLDAPSVVLEAKHPRTNLSHHVRQLREYMLADANVKYGLLTNGKEIRIYERKDSSIELVFQCFGHGIEKKLDAIFELIGRQNLSAKLEPITLPVTAEVVEKEVVKEEVVGKMAEVDRETVRSKQIEPVEEETRRTMKAIAIYHNKGGVGKTTVSVNLAAALRNKGQRVLLVDLDSQANSTFATGLIKFQFEEDDSIIKSYVLHILSSGDYDFIPNVMRPSDGFNHPEIDVIPSHINLIESQEKLNKIGASRSRLLMKLNRVKDSYDFVIIDTPPSRDLYAEIALITADYLMIPSDLKPFANQGLANVKNFLKQANEFRETMMGRTPLTVLGVLASKISTNAQFLKHTFPRQKSAVSKHYDLPLMETVIYERTSLSKCVSHTKIQGEVEIPDPQSIFTFCKIEAAADQAAEEFDNLAAEVLKQTS
jgi:cellulose biosynthesis protein BcsQ